MEKSNRIIPLIYGYLVCLIAIVVTFISISMITGSVFDLVDPLRANNYKFSYPSNLTSFTGYKIEALNGRTPLGPDGGTRTDQYTPSEDELRAAYETAREDRIASVKLDAARSITTAVLMLLVAAGLFISHWRWLAKFRSVAE